MRYYLLAVAICLVVVGCGIPSEDRQKIGESGTPQVIYTLDARPIAVKIVSDPQQEARIAELEAKVKDLEPKVENLEVWAENQGRRYK